MEDRFLNDNETYNRLLSEYKKHNTLIVGVDFDNTVFDFHKKGDTFPGLIKLVQDCQELEFILCLYTGNTDLESIAKFEKEYNVNFKYKNTSPVKPTSASKPYFNVLLDDRAGLKSSYDALSKIVHHIKINNLSSII